MEYLGKVPVVGVCVFECRGGLGAYGFGVVDDRFDEGEVGAGAKWGASSVAVSDFPAGLACVPRAEQEWHAAWLSECAADRWPHAVVVGEAARAKRVLDPSEAGCADAAGAVSAVVFIE